MKPKTKVALRFRKKKTHKKGSYFLISYFCFTKLLANINIAFNYLSEINIIIHGTGRQQILDYYFKFLPNETLVNGVPQSYNDWYVDNLLNQTNIITMRWYYQVTTCYEMFKGLYNITRINLSKFDTSKVVFFTRMFERCIYLESINLNNVNTSSAKKMDGMFAECSGLETLNLSSFDTSKVTTMFQMFLYCISLKSLDLSNFKTPALIDTRSMFSSCISLVLLNIINFNTEIVSKSDYMFQYVNKSLIFCATESTIAKIKSVSSKTYIGNYTNNCTHICLLNPQSKYIIEKNECIDDCSNDNNYSYEYNNTCYMSCPNGTHISPKKNHLCEDDLICDNYYNYDKTKCLDEIPEGFYLNDSNHKTLDKCDNK